MAGEPLLATPGHYARGPARARSRWWHHGKLSTAGPEVGRLNLRSDLDAPPLVRRLKVSHDATIDSELLLGLWRNVRELPEEALQPFAILPLEVLFGHLLERGKIFDRRLLGSRDF